MTRDERLSEAQRILRDGYHDDLSRAVAEARDLLNTPIRVDLSCGCTVRFHAEGAPTREQRFEHARENCKLSDIVLVAE